MDLDGLAHFLKRRVPFDTAFGVARHLERAGDAVSEGTVRNWVQARYAPTSENLIRLARAFGPGLLLAAYPAGAPDWLVAAATTARAAALDAEIAALEAERARLSTSLRANLTLPNHTTNNEAPADDA